MKCQLKSQDSTSRAPVKYITGLTKTHRSSPSSKARFERFCRDPSRSTPTHYSTTPVSIPASPRCHAWHRTVSRSSQLPPSRVVAHVTVGSIPVCSSRFRFSATKKVNNESDAKILSVTLRGGFFLFLTDSPAAYTRSAT